MSLNKKQLNLLKLKKLAHFFALAFLIFGCARHKKPYQDNLKNFDDLRSKYTEGKDYTITSKDKKSTTLVMSLHGCKIEPGTSELALSLSEKLNSNFYLFCGLLSNQYQNDYFFDGELHITSTHFVEPRLNKLVSKSKLCISLHGYGNDSPDFCVGGSNHLQRAKTLDQLKKHFPQHSSCELCCPPYNGTSKDNPVNKCQEQGVQIEMSPKIRKMIVQDENFKQDLVNALGISL